MREAVKESAFLFIYSREILVLFRWLLKERESSTVKIRAAPMELFVLVSVMNVAQVVGRVVPEDREETLACALGQGRAAGCMKGAS